MSLSSKVSVVLAVYNGEKFLKEQLKSLANQTLLPNEVVIGDDSSTDACGKIIKEMTDGLPFTIKYFHNIPRLGVEKNFASLLEKTSGEIIFLCDQDDVWLPEKIEKMVNEFEKNSEISGVFCDSLLVDSKLKDMNCSLWTLRRFSYERQKKFASGKIAAFEICLSHIPASGHNIAFRRSFIEKILPFPELPNSHDSWISFVIAATGRWMALPEKLTLYRVHANNLSSPDQRGILKRIKEAKNAIKNGSALWHAAILNELLKRFDKEIDPEIRILAEEKIAFSNARGAMNGKSFFIRLKTVLNLWEKGSYNKYGRSWQNVLQDLFLR